VANAVVHIDVRPTALGASTIPFHASVSTGSDGGFTFRGVPDGRFAVCAWSPTADYIEPCYWSPEVTVNVTGGRAASVAPIQMLPGADLYVRINDINGTRAAKEGTVPGFGLIVTVRTPTGTVTQVPTTGYDKTGADYHLTVPTATPFVLTVVSGGFSLADSAGKAIGSQNYNLNINIPEGAKQHREVIVIK
jgi:hypothetical protein